MKNTFGFKTAPSVAEIEKATKIANLIESTIKLNKLMIVYRSLPCEYDVILNGKVVRPGYSEKNPEQPKVPTLALKMLEERKLGFVRTLPNPKGKGKKVLALVVA
jgi:hypothetical protein